MRYSQTRYLHCRWQLYDYVDNGHGFRLVDDCANSKCVGNKNFNLSLFKMRVNYAVKVLTISKQRVNCRTILRKQIGDIHIQMQKYI